MPVLLFTVAGGPQLSPLSHLQDGEGSFNLTSRDEFILPSLISPEVRGNIPCEADHWLTPSVWWAQSCVSGQGLKLPEGRKTAWERRQREQNVNLGPGSAADGFLELIYLGSFRVENNTVYWVQWVKVGLV